MALSGTIYTNITGRQYRIEWSATQSIANNTSTITCVHKLVNNNSYSLYIGSGNVSTCNVGGVEKSYTNPAISTSGGTTHTLGTTVHTITHNSDGTKSVTIRGSYNISATLSGVWTPSIVAEGTITLDTIPRGSTFSVSSASADMGTAVTFTIDRKSTAFTHTLTLTWGGETSTIASNVATSYKWTIPLSLASDLPNSTSSGCYITCITYRSSTEISRVNLSMTLRVPASVKPSISNIATTEAVDGIASKFGAFIQSHSRLNVTITAAGSYSSTISKYSSKILDRTYSGRSFATDTLATSGSVTIETTVTDSRGRTATLTKTVTVLAYSPPTAEVFTAERCNSDGSANDDGAYAKVTYSINVTALNNKNDKSQIIKYTIKGAEEYTTVLTGNSYTLSGTKIVSTTFDIDYSYTFVLTVSDYFGEVEYVTDLSTGFTLTDYHASGRGMAIGKVAEKEDVLEVALAVEFLGGFSNFPIGLLKKSIVDMIYPVGSVYIAYNHTSPASLFGGTWTRIQNAFLWATTSGGIIGQTGGSQTHKLTVNEMPSHTHEMYSPPVNTRMSAGSGDYWPIAYNASSANGALMKSTGGGAEHNNMPPYIQVSVWRRTA